VHLAGVNNSGEQAGNAKMCDGRTLPWLQDTPTAHVWRSWQVTERDVVVLDADNKIIHVYNLTDHNLGVAANYAELRGILLTAAGAPTVNAAARTLEPAALGDGASPTACAPARAPSSHAFR
jgi:hypothetical protein